ncbi:hypothetical protein T484DRAFT_1971639, partial [Baffinella frigidus]
MVHASMCSKVEDCDASLACIDNMRRIDAPAPALSDDPCTLAMNCDESLACDDVRRSSSDSSIDDVRRTSSSSRAPTLMNCRTVEACDAFLSCVDEVRLVIYTPSSSISASTIAVHEPDCQAPRARGPRPQGGRLLPNICAQTRHPHPTSGAGTAPPGGDSAGIHRLLPPSHVRSPGLLAPTHVHSGRGLAPGSDLFHRCTL